MKTHDRLDRLKDIIRDAGKLAVAYSAGVDSTFLLYTAHEVLGDGCLAVTARSCLCPRREMDEAEEFCRTRGIRHIVLTPDVFAVEGFAENPRDRCYICKKNIFGEICRLAASEGMRAADGTNADDMGDDRPGMRAAEELGVLSPMRDAGLTKADIRALSKEAGLGTWDKPSYACLATRIPHGDIITRDKLRLIEEAEYILQDMGFRQVRVRLHGNDARIETERERIAEAAGMAGEICSRLSGLGFGHISLDLSGYGQAEAGGQCAHPPVDLCLREA